MIIFVNIWRDLYDFYHVEVTLSHTIHLNVIEDQVYLFLTTVFYEDNDIFQQDNAPCHITNYTEMASGTWKWFQCVNMDSQLSICQSNWTLTKLGEKYRDGVVAIKKGSLWVTLGYGRKTYLLFFFILLRWGFLIWELFFYCGLFVLTLVVFCCFFSLRFGQISPLAFFRWLTATSDRNAESFNVYPVITAFHNCCLSHHVFDQVNLWPVWVGIETAIFWQCSPGTVQKKKKNY